MLTVRPLSRASSLPQVLRHIMICRNRSTALRPTLAAVTRFLTFPEEHLVAHHRLVRVFGLHMLDVIVVVGHADHQARGLTEVFTEATQVIEHAGNPRSSIWHSLEGRFFIRTFLAAPGGNPDL